MNNKYLACLALGIQDALVYRANFLLSMITVLFPVFVQLFLWLNLFASSAGNPLFSFSFPQMMAYVLYANIISRLVRTSFEYDINRDIKDGALSVFIVKPVSYYFYRLYTFIGQKIVQSASILIFFVAVMIFTFFVYGLIIPPGNIALFLLSLVFAFFLNFSVFFAVGMFGFWLHEIGFLFEAARIVILVFSGGIFPLDIFGKTFAKILSLLPFSYVIYFPTNILCGRLAIDDIVFGLAIQFLWTILVSFFAIRLYYIGMKRFSATGG